MPSFVGGEFGLMFMEGVLEILRKGTDFCARWTASQLGGHFTSPSHKSAALICGW